MEEAEILRKKRICQNKDQAITLREAFWKKSKLSVFQTFKAFIESPGYSELFSYNFDAHLNQKQIEMFTEQCVTLDISSQKYKKLSELGCVSD